MEGVPQFHYRKKKKKKKYFRRIIVYTQIEIFKINDQSGQAPHQHQMQNV